MIVATFCSRLLSWEEQKKNVVIYSPVLPERRLQLQVWPVLRRLHAVDQRHIELAAAELLPTALPISPRLPTVPPILLFGFFLPRLQQAQRALLEVVVQDAHPPQGGVGSAASLA